MIDKFEIISDNYVLVTEDNGDTWGQIVSDEHLTSMEALSDFIQSRYETIHQQPVPRMKLEEVRNKPIPPRPQGHIWKDGWEPENIVNKPTKSEILN